LRAWAEALTGRHPSLLDGRFPERRDECALMRTQAEVIAELVRFGGPRNADSPGVVATAATRLTADLIGLAGASELPASALETAHRALFEGGQVREAARVAARSAWLRLGGERPEVADYVLDLLAEELAAQAPTRLEPRFASLWRVAAP
jgi:hypothetical protein